VDPVDEGREAATAPPTPAAGEALAAGSTEPSARAAAAPAPAPEMIASPALATPASRRAPRPVGFADEDYAKSRIDIYREFYRAALTWSLDDYLRQRARRELLDGEAAYQVYVFLRTCLDTPRSPEAATRRIEGLERSAANRPADFDESGLDERIEAIQRGVARCEGLDSVEGLLEPVLLDWLTRAADRGYPQAQLAYYQSARWLLERKPQLIYRNPDVVTTYRTQALAYLTTALESGHSEAFTELAMAYMEGIVVERDALQSYAHAHAADLAGHGQNEIARSYLSLMEPELSPDQLREARALGRTLCEAYCR